MFVHFSYNYVSGCVLPVICLIRNTSVINGKECKLECSHSMCRILNVLMENKFKRDKDKGNKKQRKRRNERSGRDVKVRNVQ